MKLHVGCGNVILSGWTNLDIDNIPGVNIVDDAAVLSKISDESCDIIYACHVLEHFGRHEVGNVLKIWNKKLKKNGILRLAVPDFQKVIQWYQKNPELEDVTGLTVGGQKTKYDFHKVIFDKKKLTNLLTNSGFYDVREWDWRKTDHSNIDDYSQAYLPHMNKENGLLMSLNIEAKKIN